ncbi:(Fe-S)-binding protein [Kushneria phosphatilytica]|uniref:(Fe-S)-binding protein n=1 Tax=Kushneria phosphatilytica TaxID=657387 RepID=A0A1S1NY16_9GAMM|nr:(Fe-S)-binding protein [Kushneria phosphatilytica]OHV12765.1 (Fe-S)-binding protein [Kushneria phosphatilytica]QEL10606.1 (Fe-S)-binding protein [Kushneria phosphatilytica]
MDPLLSVLILAALAMGALGAWRRIRLWRQGRPASVNLLQGMLRMPRRYLVDLHHVVARDRYIAHTHVATAGGFVAAMALAIVVHVLGFENAIMAGLLGLASLAMFVGTLFVARRRVRPPARLSKGAWQRLPKSLMAFSFGMLMVSLPLGGLIPEGAVSALTSLVLGILVGWGLLELLVGMGWGGPMKHAFAGASHLAFHRRPERFTDVSGESRHPGSRSTALLPLDLDGEQTQGSEHPMGVGRPGDFNWQQLLGFDACVQCGRCEAACPAHAAGQPLNPKKLIQDMVVGMAGGSDAHYAGTPHTGHTTGEHGGAPGERIVPQLVEPETLWSCTTCRACVEECPMMIEHVDAVVDMRRFLTLEEGATPEKGAVALDNLIATDNPGGFDNASRLDWAADLELPRIRERPEGVDVLLWLGDGAFDMRNQRTLRSLITVMRAAGVDFAVVGEEERDSGDLARRLGDEATFQQLAQQNIATLSQYRFERIVTCDPHSFHVLGREYPDFGGHYRVLHHSGLLAELIDDQRLRLAPAVSGSSLTWHDPCYLGRYNGEFEAPRRVLRALGMEVREMARSGYRSRCCGGGGGAALTDVPGKQRISDMRMGDARDTGAEVVAVGCPQCTAMLEGVVEPGPQVLDLAELVARALVVEESNSSTLREPQEEMSA